MTFEAMGEATQLAMDYIMDIDMTLEDEDVPGEGYIEQLDVMNTFRDGINKRIAQIGYDGDLDDAGAKVAFLTKQFKKHDIEPISTATLKNWLTRKPPNTKGRENVFKLCFALEMNAVETAEFFLKAYLNRPFNCKNMRESVYLYCLANQRTYQDAMRIINMIDSMPTIYADGSIATEEVRQGLIELHTEDEVIRYLIEHRYQEKAYHESAWKKIEELLASCYEIATRERDYIGDQMHRSVEATMRATEKSNRKKDAVQSVDELMDIIYGYDVAEVHQPKGYTIGDSELPNALKSNWIDRQAFSRMRKRENASDEVYRKALMILFFYEYYGGVYFPVGKDGKIDIAKRVQANKADLREYGEEFEMQLNDVLNDCGYVQTYARNPFDWMIIYCTAFPNPLDQFRQIIEKYILDVADE